MGDGCAGTEGDTLTSRAWSAQNEPRKLLKTQDLRGWQINLKKDRRFC